MVTAFMSCNQGETLQQYYIAKQDAPSFISIDIPTSLVSVDQATMTDVQKEAYNSVSKLNMLGYRLTEDNEAEYKEELAKVQSILKDDRYEELFRGGNSTDGRIVVKYIGTDSTIDELILFGSANDRGFAIVRVLGDNMEPAKIMKLGNVIKDATSQEGSVAEFMNFFK